MTAWFNRVLTIFEGRITGEFDPRRHRDGIDEVIKTWFPYLGQVQSEIYDDHVIFSSVKNGIRKKTRIDSRLLESKGFRDIVKIHNELKKIGRPPFKVIRGENETEVRNLREAAEKVFEEAKKGYSLQRYKGLGEMNPEQLWETTMDPANRSMLKVSIDDAVETDMIFSTLMGDDVVPRREFIETNALRVSNLDI